MFLIFWYWKFDQKHFQNISKIIQILTRKTNLFGQENDKVCWRGEKKKKHWNFYFSFTISDNDNNDIIILTILTNINSAFLLLSSFCIS
jgi:hypothetical protein